MRSSLLSCWPGLSKKLGKHSSYCYCFDGVLNEFNWAIQTWGEPFFLSLSFKPHLDVLFQTLRIRVPINLGTWGLVSWFVKSTTNVPCWKETQC